MLKSLIDRLQHGDRLALARLLTLASRGERLEEMSAVLPQTSAGSRVVAITGSGGVGKSTLVGKLIELIRAHGQTVAVLACDPQSPLTGGALLGDRFRMPDRTDDDGVFIRSLAAPSGHGAIADHLDVMVRLLENFGFGVILIETVGAGQGDTVIRDLADVLVLLVQPEMGDDLQWEKAGLPEVADVVVVHKADLPHSELVETQVRSMLALSKDSHIPVLRVSARTSQGLEQLWETIAGIPSRRVQHNDDGAGLLQAAHALLADWFAAAKADQLPELQQLLTQWQHGRLNQAEAASALVQLLEREYGPAHEKPTVHCTPRG